MKPLWVMTGACGVSWLVVTSVAAGVNPEVLLGMAGPLVSAGATWIVTSRTHATAPERVMGVMVVGLAAKMLFFGAYLVIMLRGLELRPTLFVTSFTSYLIALYGLEAVYLHRLFRNTPAPR